LKKKKLHTYDQIKTKFQVTAQIVNKNFDFHFEENFVYIEKKMSGLEDSVSSTQIPR
jgi:hypothetical protein